MLQLLLLLNAQAAPSYQDLGFVLTAPPSGPFASGIGAPTVDRVGGTYALYFESESPSLPSGCATSWYVGRATSSDGVAWTLDPDPVLVPDESDEGSTRHCSITQPATVHDGTSWHLFASISGPSGAGIGWATSPDGTTITWREEPLIPDEDGGLGLASAAVLNGTVYLLWVDYPSFYLSRYDIPADTWVSVDAPVFEPADVGAWASTWLLGPSLTCDPTEQSRLAVTFGGDDAGGARSLGLARSNDGLAWFVDSGSPFTGGDVDYSSLNHWDVLGQGTGYRMWYSKTDPASGRKAIGLARTPDAKGEVTGRSCVRELPPDDTGTPPDDTGTPPDDTGTPPVGDTDSGTPQGDGGGYEGGCGCATATSPSAPWALLALFAARRRRPR